MTCRYHPLTLPALNHDPLHGYALSAIPRAMRPAPMAPTSFTHAITTISLAATIHGTDQAVRKAMWRSLISIKPQHREAILGMLNTPSPLAHVLKYLKTVPAHLLRRSSPTVTAARTRPAALSAA